MCCGPASTSSSCRSVLACVTSVSRMAGEPDPECEYLFWTFETVGAGRKRGFGQSLRYEVQRSPSARVIACARKTPRQGCSSATARAPRLCCPGSRRARVGQRLPLGRRWRCWLPGVRWIDAVRGGEDHLAVSGQHADRAGGPTQKICRFNDIKRPVAGKFSSFVVRRRRMCD